MGDRGCGARTHAGLEKGRWLTCCSPILEAPPRGAGFVRSFKLRRGGHPPQNVEIVGHLRWLRKGAIPSSRMAFTTGLMCTACPWKQSPGWLRVIGRLNSRVSREIEPDPTKRPCRSATSIASLSSALPGRRLTIWLCWWRSLSTICPTTMSDNAAIESGCRFANMLFTAKRSAGSNMRMY